MAVEQSEVQAQTEPQEVIADEQPVVDSIESVADEVAAEETPEVESAPTFDPSSVLTNEEQRQAIWEALAPEREKEKADHANTILQKARADERKEQAKDEHTRSAAAMVAKATVEAMGGTWDPNSMDERTVERLSRIVAMPLQANLAVAIETNFDELAPAVVQFMGGTEAAQRALLERVTEAKTVGEKSAAIGVLLAGAKENIEAVAEEKASARVEAEVKVRNQAELDALTIQLRERGYDLKAILEEKPNGRTVPNTPKGSAPGAGLTYENMTKMTAAEIKALPDEVFEKVVNGG